MHPISFKRHRFPPDVIRYALWLYLRFTLSIRDVEELLAQRGIEASREAVRCWVIKFGPLIAANLRRRRSPPTGRWHLDEMVVRIRGRRMYLWRAVDDEGEVLDVLVQKRRNKHAALKLLRRLLKNQGIHPETITTDKLASYRAAARILGLTSRPAACARTIGRKIPTWPSDGESESSKSSSPKVQPKGSSPATPPSTTRSTLSPT
jgi:putative transposase